MKLVIVLVFFYFSHLIWAFPYFTGPPIFNPMFSASPLSLLAGQELIAFCSYPLNTAACLQDWSSQAVPLSVYQNGQAGMEYYMPAFIDGGVSDIDPRGHEDWTLFMDRISKASSPDYERFFYQHKEDNERYIIVEQKKSGETSFRKAQSVLVRAEDIEQGVNDQNQPVLQTSRETLALPATTKEVKPGCFVIDKPEERTEASYCLDCYTQETKNEALAELFQDPQFQNHLAQYMLKVKNSSRHKVRNQVHPSMHGESSIEKICSPEKSVDSIIRNFNRTCPAPYKNNFEKFFQDSYCQSCKAGVPPELMFAMMSIESAGNCPADVESRYEESAGLFQVNSRVHSCTDHRSGKTFRKGTSANLQCLKNPVNSLNKGLNILIKHYREVNPSGVSRQEVSCSNPSHWVSLETEQRDKWRRAVAAYNGGPGWVTRAIKTAKEKKALTESTAYLPGSDSSSYKNSPDSWENVRTYFFLEKLLKSNTIGTGRQIKFTISNVAHTEAVLGRSVQGASPAMVDIWSQYIKDKKNFSCPE